LSSASALAIPVSPVMSGASLMLYGVAAPQVAG
jgi:hypothetical protein